MKSAFYSFLTGAIVLFVVGIWLEKSNSDYSMGRMFGPDKDTVRVVDTVKSVDTVIVQDLSQCPVPVVTNTFVVSTDSVSIDTISTYVNGKREDMKLRIIFK